ncbi:MAG TPA: LuxR C-terminal-related transcriptional regulator [Clostridia bacterium]|nr:LuxR C-terminal-related transcriptional regulator [Clostridia bacterium]
MAMPEPHAPLRSKLGVQVRTTRQVVRERLRARLDAATEARLVLVSAPAGFGKSSLLAEWLGSADVSSAWLTLDRGDNDVVRFARGLLAAAGILTGNDADVAVPAPDPQLALERVLDALAGALDADPDRRVAIVLDDYHLVDEPAVQALVGSLLERLPPRALLAIATRADPRLPLARLRARGELLEIRAEDLRFEAAEAGELLRAAGIELGSDELEVLVGRTEGWAAALRLAAISLDGRPDQAELVHRFGASHRFVLDYVTDEVLAGLPPATQDFLLRTSILERLSGPLCDAVTGRADGQERLEELERLNLLITPLDDERCWYRYHALFAEILRTRLRALHADEVAGLHARASAWHEERADDDEAVHHALRSADTERMARCVAVACGRRLNAGELATVRRWLDALPVELVRDHSQLAAAYAWYFIIEGDTDATAEWIAIADRAHAVGHDGGPQMRSGIPTQLAMLRSHLARLGGDVDAAVEEARRAVDLVPVGLPPAHEAILRGTADGVLAVALLAAGDTSGAVAAYESGLVEMRAGGNELAAGRAVADLADIAIGRGDPVGAIRRCESELALPSEGSRSADAAIWTALARARATLGHDEEARTAAQRGLELAARSGDGQVVAQARAVLDRADRPVGAGGDGDGSLGGRPLLAGLAEQLTEREIEVLRLVALGRSNSQAAAELFVTVGTVKSHLHTISGKLGATNRVEAVARGRELGLLD